MCNRNYTLVLDRLFGKIFFLQYRNKTKISPDRTVYYNGTRS